MKTLDEIVRSGDIMSYTADLMKLVETLVPSVDGGEDHKCLTVLMVTDGLSLDGRSNRFYISNAASDDEKAFIVRWLRNQADRIESGSGCQVPKPAEGITSVSSS